MILALKLIWLSAVNSYFLKCFIDVMQGLPAIDSSESEIKKKKLRRKKVKLLRHNAISSIVVLYTLQ